MSFILSARKYFLALTSIFLASRTHVSGQDHCGLCCGRSGSDGPIIDNCGPDCKAGPCSDSNGLVPVAGMVTDKFFYNIANQTAESCEGRGFYTRDSFIDAIKSYPQFGAVDSVDYSKREIAAFFAHVAGVTLNMCYIEAINGTSRDTCDETNKEYPCAPNKSYHGRGPLQLSWNSNYGPAGNNIGFDGLNNPEIVATNPAISFKASLWYWMTNCHDLLISGRGFGATIRAMNSVDCDGGSPSSVDDRVEYYTQYCSQLQVDPGNDLRC